MTSLKLIHIYFRVCELYNAELRWEVQRFSPNRTVGKITDEELLTIYLYCMLHEQKYKQSSMYKCIKEHWHSWFPYLPNYQNFNARMNRLAPAFQSLVSVLMGELNLPADSLSILVGDSMPIITCSHKRQAKVAPNLVDKGFCPTKNLHYYGVKLHTLALTNPGHLPLPKFMAITPASCHDLSALRPVLANIRADAVVLDKAYCDAQLAITMKQNGTTLVNPIKNIKATPLVIKQLDQAFNDLFNTSVAKIRQPIESFFNWIQQLTRIEYAAKVRSQTGLIVHVFARLAVACIALLNF